MSESKCCDCDCKQCYYKTVCHIENRMRTSDDTIIYLGILDEYKFKYIYAKSYIEKYLITILEMES